MQENVEGFFFFSESWIRENESGKRIGKMEMAISRATLQMSLCTAGGIVAQRQRNRHSPEAGQ